MILEISIDLNKIIQSLKKNFLSSSLLRNTLDPIFLGDVSKSQVTIGLKLKGHPSYTNPFYQNER